MQYSIAAIAALAGGSWAQSLSSVVAANPNLSDFAAILKKVPMIGMHIGMADGVTLLAPGNSPQSKHLLEFILGPDAAKTPGLVEWTLSYHVLKGVLPAAAIPASVFAETYVGVHNSSYSMVTGSQRVHITKQGNKVSAFSALDAQVNVTKADIKFDNGIIHVIDGVLSLPISPVETATALGLTGLVKSLNAAGLSKTVDSLRDITIFAPSNAAFDKASSVLAGLSKAQVAGALTYHVVKGVGYSTSLKDGQLLPTVQGGNLKVKIRNGVVYINSAKVVKPDFLTKSGVVHLIDSVLTP